MDFRWRSNRGCADSRRPARSPSINFLGTSTHLYAHLRWEGGPCEDVPLVFPLGPAFEPVWEGMDEALGLYSRHQLRAEVKVWDAILTAQATVGSAVPALPPAVALALSEIDRRLAEQVSVRDLADRVFLSHNQLTRLFRESLGETVVGTIHERRMTRARHLLLHSTMPIKQVAVQVGLPDLQHFNKSVRKRFGVSPSGLRGWRG